METVFLSRIALIIRPSELGPGTIMTSLKGILRALAKSILRKAKLRDKVSVYVKFVRSLFVFTWRLSVRILTGSAVRSANEPQRRLYSTQEQCTQPLQIPQLRSWNAHLAQPWGWGMR